MPKNEGRESARYRDWCVLYVLALCLIWPARACFAAFNDDFTHARAMAMGATCTGFVADGDAILMNPAGIWQIPQELAITQASLYAGLDDGSSIQQQLASYAYQHSSQDTFGLAWKHLSVTHLYSEDTYALGYARRAELYKNTGEQRTLRFAYTLGVGVRLLRWDSAPTVGHDAQVIEDLSGPVRLAFDLGVLVHPSANTSVGVAFQNLNQPDISSAQGESVERLPTRSRLGLALNSTRIIWALDLVFEVHRVDLRMGAEWDVFPELLKLRLGVQLQNLAWGANVMTGMGYSPSESLRIDYAFMQAIQGIDAPRGSHRVTVVYNF